jgi:hypothetical protein
MTTANHESPRQPWRHARLTGCPARGLCQPHPGDLVPT